MTDNTLWASSNTGGSRTDLGDGGEGLKAVQILTAGPPSDPLEGGGGGALLLTTHHH